MYMTIVAVVFGLLAVNLAALYWLGLREARSLSEYTQHLMLDPKAFEAERAKFLAYLTSTASKSSAIRTTDAAAALARMAGDMRVQLMFSNVAARKAVALGRKAKITDATTVGAVAQQDDGE
jgi:hypothetical protein